VIAEVEKRVADSRDLKSNNSRVVARANPSQGGDAKPPVRGHVRRIAGLPAKAVATVRLVVSHSPHLAASLPS
jgi:hypothetical protein